VAHVFAMLMFIIKGSCIILNKICHYLMLLSFGDGEMRTQMWDSRLEKKCG